MFVAFVVIGCAAVVAVADIGKAAGRAREWILLYKLNIKRAQRAHGKNNGRDRKRGRKKEKRKGSESTQRAEKTIAIINK